MSPVIVIFGAGTGLGASLARRFGREGFRVALVGRRLARLEDLVLRLRQEGVEAAPFSADLGDPTQVRPLIESIRGRFGRIDVVEYGPVGAEQGFTAAADLDADTLQSLFRLFALTPVEVVRAVLPEMRERGDGAILLTHGYSAAQAIPFYSGLGPAMAAARNYLYSLHGELEGTGVFAGTLTVGASVERSEMSEIRAAAAVETADDTGTNALPTVDPDLLAEIYWDMYTRRDRVETFHPEALATV